MKYGTRYCFGLPASRDASWKSFANVPKLSMDGFFITPSTVGSVCSGATFKWPPTWWAVSSRMYSGDI